MIEHVHNIIEQVHSLVAGMYIYFCCNYTCDRGVTTATLGCWTSRRQSQRQAQVLLVAVSSFLRQVAEEPSRSGPISRPKSPIYPCDEIGQSTTAVPNRFLVFSRFLAFLILFPSQYLSQHEFSWPLPVQYL